MMIPTQLSTLFFLAVVCAPVANSNTVYISDELTVPLRSGPSGSHRILHRGLASGTQLAVVGEDVEAGFTQIRTTRGTEGWIRSQYLVDEPIAKLRLITAQREITRLEQQVQRAQSQISNLTQDTVKQDNAKQASANEIDELKVALDRITSISSSAVETHEENLRLQDVNARLRDELGDIAEERNLLHDNAANEGIMLGAGFILLGLIAGVLLKARPQRSAWS
ncbi:MAG: TIGR04211 family SH3 domain-containing protein [Pseudomonadales bacterium]|nr:TIGR04211 family SH3 domain-containing protein [Pseudomonadales bacterium]